MAAVTQNANAHAAREAAVSIVRKLARAGFTAYLAGGCVRDELLGLVPEDYDVATDARPEQVKGLFRSVSEVGASFGVLLVRRRGATIEVATFRTEGAYSDRRRPDEVRYADAAADAHRRDYTINALFLDPLASPGVRRSDGEMEAVPPPLTAPRGCVIDFVGGVLDLAQGLLRAVGDPDQRLAEDHLRGLRGVRIAARHGFRIDAPTSQAIRRHASALAGVSRERVGEEIRRMLTPGATRVRAVELLEDHLLAQPALTLGPVEAVDCPTVRAMRKEAAFATALAAWALDRLGAPRAAPPTLGLIDTIVRTLRRSLCLSNQERDALRSALKGLRAMQRDWDNAAVALRKRWAASPWFEAALALLEARAPARARALREQVEALARTPSGLAPTPLLTGDDVVEIVGSPGPAVGRILRRVYDAQLEDAVQTKADARALAVRLAQREETH